MEKKIFFFVFIEINRFFSPNIHISILTNTCKFNRKGTSKLKQNHFLEFSHLIYLLINKIIGMKRLY